MKYCLYMDIQSIGIEIRQMTNALQKPLLININETKFTFVASKKPEVNVRLLTSPLMIAVLSL